VAEQEEGADSSGAGVCEDGESRVSLIGFSYLVYMLIED